jgi:hypothetical protein
MLEGGESVVVQAVRGLAADHLDAALVELEAAAALSRRQVSASICLYSCVQPYPQAAYLSSP